MTSTLTLSGPRRRALAIGVPFALVLIAYGGFTYVAQFAQDNFRIHTAVAPIAGTVKVSLASGDISVGPSGDDQAHLSGVVSYSIFRPAVHWQTTPTGTVLNGPNCLPIAGNCGADLTLTVPTGQTVDASSGSGNVQASGTDGRLTLSSGSGNVSVKQVSGPLDLGSSSGNVTGTHLSAPDVKVDDSSGNVNLYFIKPPSQVKVSASSGNITVAVPGHVAYAVDTSASSGSTSIRVPTNPSSHYVIRLTAASGDIDIVPSRP
jgi:Putative adhesin